METFKKLIKFEQKIPLSTVGILITIGSVILAIYMGFFYEKKPSIMFDVVSEANVLDIKEKVSELEIVFKGVDINKSDLNLRIVTLKISNDGGVDIRPGDYDNSMPWGFKIDSGKIIEANLLDSNSEYIQSRATPKIKDEKTVIFDKFIFDKNKYFFVKLLLLHAKDHLPIINPIGKIAGIEKIPLIKSYQAHEEVSLLKDIFKNDVKTQIVRIIVYPIIFVLFIVGFVILIILILIPIESIFSRMVWSKKRNKLVQHYKELHKKSLSESCEFLYDDYVISNLYLINKIKKFLDDEKRLKSEIAIFENPIFKDLIKVDPKDRFFDLNGIFETRAIVEQLKDKNILKIEGEEVKFDEQFIKAFRDFYDFLKEVGQIKK